MKVPLLGGAYQARSIIANAQRCVNLYPEKNPEDAEAPMTHYPTPGLVLLGTAPNGNGCRANYLASNGDLYVVYGSYVYFVSPQWQFVFVGNITANRFNPVSMGDNGTTILITDGSVNGYTINMASRAFAQVVDANFFGADRVDYLDTFMLLNKPGTNVWYITPSNAIGPIDPLDFATKVGYPDPLQSLICVHREIYLIGTMTTEVWFNAGGATFPFEEMPGTFIQHGTVAKYTIATQDLAVYFLSRDRQGQVMVIRCESFKAKRISTHAIEQEFQSYARVDDAIGITYQQDGHVFYGVTFPTAQKSWFYDEATELWHQRGSIDGNGNVGRVRYSFHAPAYGKNVVGDALDGKLYALDLNTYTENGDPIPRIRSFPHGTADGKRVTYAVFQADMECGTGQAVNDARGVPIPPQVALRWSDDRGKTFGNPVLQSMGAQGKYLTQPQWRRLGLARDRVFELSWSVNAKTALNGAYVDAVPCGT